MNPASPHRLIWLIIVSALVVSVVLYGLLLLVIAHGGSSQLDTGQPSVRIWFAGIATLLLFASLLWMRWKMTFDEAPSATIPSASSLPGPETYLTRSMVALALAEMPSILGFVMCLVFGGRLSDYAPFGVGSLAVILFGIAPRGEHYWATRAAREGLGRDEPPAAGGG
jgi:hypothetical protein